MYHLNNQNHPTFRLLFIKCSFCYFDFNFVGADVEGELGFDSSSVRKGAHMQIFVVFNGNFGEEQLSLVLGRWFQTVNVSLNLSGQCLESLSSAYPVGVLMHQIWRLMLGNKKKYHKVRLFTVSSTCTNSKTFAVYISTIDYP